MVNEAYVKNSLLKLLGADDSVRLFNNPVGRGWMGQVIGQRTIDGRNRVALEPARIVDFGLIRGSADLIGWKSVEITPDMVGKTIAIFLSIETKAPTGGRIRPDQRIWQRNVSEAGGIALITNTPQATVDGINDWLTQLKNP